MLSLLIVLLLGYLAYRAIRRHPQSGGLPGTASSVSS
jgi:hypothetical protein